MAVVDGRPDAEVAARCRALGIKGFAAFARRTGRRITDLSAEKALAILSAEADGPHATFGERWATAVATPGRTKQEREAAMRAFNATQIAAMRAALRKKDEDEGLVTTPDPAHETDTDPRNRRPDRPVFGQPPPVHGGRRARPAERLSVFAGVDGRD